MLTEEEDDEFFGADDVPHDGVSADTATTAKITEEMTSVGYMEARGQARGGAMQDGFDEAYPRGMQLGQACGKAAVMLKNYGGNMSLLQTIESGDLVQMSRPALLVWLSSLLAELQHIAAAQVEEHGQARQMINDVTDELQQLIASLSLA